MSVQGYIVDNYQILNTCVHITHSASKHLSLNMSPIIWYFILPTDRSGKFSLASENFCVFIVMGCSSFHNSVNLPLTFRL